MMCVTCYGRLKAFESYRSKCIKNQEKFEITFKPEDPVSEIEDTCNDYVEYIDDIDEEDHYTEDSQEIFEHPDPDEEVCEAVENILEDDDGNDIETTTKPVIKIEKQSDEDRSKGKEIYRKLLMQCDLCLKMIEKNRMEGHINKHNGVRPFTCSECQKKFYCRQLLRLHRTSLHTNVRIKCDSCDKSFPSQRALYAHTLRHKNRDKYECELCEVCLIML